MRYRDHRHDGCQTSEHGLTAMRNEGYFSEQIIDLEAVNEKRTKARQRCHLCLKPPSTMLDALSTPGFQPIESRQ